MASDDNKLDDAERQIAEAYHRENLEVKDHISGTRLFFRRAAAHCGLPVPHVDVNSPDGRGVLLWDDDTYRPLYTDPDSAGGLARAYATLLDDLLDRYLSEARNLDKDIYSDTLRLSTEIRSILGSIRTDLEGFVRHDVVKARYCTVEGVDNPWEGLRNFRDALKSNMAVYAERLDRVWMQYQEAYNLEHGRTIDGPIDDPIPLKEALRLVIDKLNSYEDRERKRLERAYKSGRLRTEGERKNRIFSRAQIEEYILERKKDIDSKKSADDFDEFADDFDEFGDD